MAPRINDGDVLFVDRGASGMAGNGTYVVEYMGRAMVQVVFVALTEFVGQLGDGAPVVRALHEAKLLAIDDATPDRRVVSEKIEGVDVMGVVLPGNEEQLPALWRAATSAARQQPRPKCGATNGCFYISLGAAFERTLADRGFNPVLKP